MDNKSEVVSANEINKFLHCPYQWYYERYYGKKYILLAYKNKKPKVKVNKKKKKLNTTMNNFARGRKFHSEYLENEYKYRAKIRQRVKVLIISALIFIVIFLTLYFNWDFAFFS